MRAPLVAVALLAAAACGGSAEVVHGLSELEANEIMVVLEAKGIDSEKQAEPGRVTTWKIVVSGVDAKDARRYLVANHLPRAHSQGLPEVYPAGGGGLIPTKSEEKAKFMMALQGEIEKKLKTLPGIVSAQVTVVQPEKDIVRDLDAPPPLSTASVAIVYNAVDPRGSAAVSRDEVKDLVASSVEDLKPGNVTVVMKPNEPAVIVSEYADSGTIEAPITASSWLGLKFADKASRNKLVGYFAVGGIIGVLCLGVGVGGIVRSMSLRRAKARAEAELTSMRKAGRATQTGLQQG